MDLTHFGQKWTEPVLALGPQTVTQLASVYREWAKAIDRPNPPRIDAVFLDWSKAFD